MKNPTEIKEELNKYADLVGSIRILSAVSISAANDAASYSRKLTQDYEKIGRLGERCREILRETLFPIIRSDSDLSIEVIDVLQDFCDLLLDPPSGEELDLFLLFEVSERLLREPLLIQDKNKYAKQLNIHISSCYSNINRVSRVTIDKDIPDHYIKDGLRAAKIACDMLYDRELYLSLSDDGKSNLLRAARFYSAIYDTFYFTDEGNVLRFQALKDSIKLSEDPFYTDNTPNYNWVLHKLRSIEHMGQLTERGNRWGMTLDCCKEICSYLNVLKEAHDSDPETVQKILPEFHYELILLRNNYFAKNIGVQEYRSELMKLYNKYENNGYDMYSVQINILIPSEYLATIQDEELTPELKENLLIIYKHIINYILHSVNMDAFNFMQEYLIGFLEEFIEIPGEMTFKDMGLYCLAALHPPTYVHSLQVAEIGKCIASHLMKKKPKIFLEQFGYTSAEEVQANSDRILDHIYNCGLCHDFGKITMIDSIFIYGRDLLDREFSIIRMHTLMGEKMLKKYDSTRSYAPEALLHHVWYNAKGGYPGADDKTGLKSLVSSNILEAADCIDAATDRIGRSYSKGKSLEDVIGEFKKGSGTRYAPYVVDLFSDDDVISDIREILDNGRQENYKKAYNMLHEV